MRTEHPMFKFHYFSLTAWLLLAAPLSASAQQAPTWEQVRLRFEQNNPKLLADQLSIDESRAQEITAFLLRKASGDRSRGRSSRPASAICTNGVTSGSYVWRAPKRGL